MTLKRILLILLCGLTWQLDAQDFHFSQWQNAPMIINPGLTGAYLGNLRVNVIGRDQGRAVAGAGNEFQDMSLTIEYNIDFGLTEGDWIGAGLTTSRSFSAGVADFSRAFTGASMAYHLAYGKRKDRVFTVGAKYGAYTTAFNEKGRDEFTTSRILEDQTVWQDDQDLTALVNNIGMERDKSKSDFMVGVTLTTPTSKTADLRIGVAMDRILNPIVESGGRRDTSMTAINTRGERFNRRTNGFISYYSSVSKKLVFNPNVVYQYSGGTSNLLVQALFKYLANPEKKLILTGGLGLRMVNSTDIPVYLGAEVKDWRVGLAYDLNIGGLRPSNNTFGALEIGISKIFNWYKKAVVEPVFICPRL